MLGAGHDPHPLWREGSGVRFGHPARARGTPQRLQHLQQSYTGLQFKAALGAMLKLNSTALR